MPNFDFNAIVYYNNNKDLKTIFKQNGWNEKDENAPSFSELNFKFFIYRLQRTFIIFTVNTIFLTTHVYLGNVNPDAENDFSDIDTLMTTCLNLDPDLYALFKGDGITSGQDYKFVTREHNE